MQAHASGPIEAPWNFGLLLREVLVQSTSTVMASQDFQASLEFKGLSLNFLAPADRQAFQFLLPKASGASFVICRFLSALIQHV